MQPMPKLRSVKALISTIGSSAVSTRKKKAIAEIPLELVQDVALIGPIGKIKDELAAWKETCLTTMMISGPPQMVQTAAELVLG